MQTRDFDYELPEELIAQQPLASRSASRLLIVSPESLVDAGMRDFPAQVTPRDLVVFNDTRVIPARLYGRKAATGGHVEIVVERVDNDHEARVLLRASKSPAAGTEIIVVTDESENAPRLTVTGRDGEFFCVRSEMPWMELLHAHGAMPLPPYISRAADQTDADRYQSLMAARDGAVAAPTASLHFDDELIAAVRAAGAEVGTVTLHVGAGTFQPVRVDDIRQHQMHGERYEVSEELAEQIRRTRARGGRVLAIGTTVVRALESAAKALDPQQSDRIVATGWSESRLFITPGYRFAVVDALLTNFHLPKSTLLMLVSAFAGQDRIREAYAHAVRERYRFFSYGDAMWLSTRDESSGGDTQ